jgi:hypothetical protein
MATYIVGSIDNRHGPSTQPRDAPPTEHRCSQCFTPGFGKSSIRCRNEPPTSPSQKWLVKSDGILRNICDTKPEADQLAEDLNFNYPDGGFYVEKARTA